MFRILAKRCTSQIISSPTCRHHRASLLNRSHSDPCRHSTFLIHKQTLATSIDADAEKREVSRSIPADDTVNTEKLLNSLDEEDRFGSLRSDRPVGSAEKREKSFRKQNRNNLVSFENPQVQKWSTTFGTLSAEWQKEIKLEEKRYSDDEREEKEEDRPYLRLSEEGRLHAPHWYGRRIAKLGRAGKVYEAIDVLETQMLKVDRVRPTQYVFTVLIGVLGRAGYTKKAFQLFNKMKKFGLDPQAPTYTALFNACSNSPWVEDGLRRADNLRQLMSEKEYEPNIMTYHAMIKAYARCGSLQKAFSLVDEAWEAGLKIDEQCYSFLLMACVSDKEAGLKHAIEVWRLMRKRRVKPNTYHYNLLLRAVRDCSLGDDSYAAQLLSNSTSETNAPTNQSQPRHTVTNSSRSDRQSAANSNAHLKLQNVEANQRREDILSSDVTTNQKKISSAINTTQRNLVASAESTTEDVIESSSTQNLPSAVPVVPLLPSRPIHEGSSILDLNIPNLLNPNPIIPAGVALRTPSGPGDRLVLLGGLPGVLSHMKRDGAAPDIKTFSQLLECVSPTCTAEADLLAAMVMTGVKPDVDLMSALIRRRNQRKDHSAAWDVLRLIERAGLKATERTFGCLAMGCTSVAQLKALLKHMQEAEIYPTIEIFEILLEQSRHNFSYKYEVLVALKQYNVRPSQKIIEKLEESLSCAKSIIVKKEKGEDVAAYYQTDGFISGYRRFMKRYVPWLRSVELEPVVHPWDLYRQPTPSTSPLDSLTPSLQKQVAAVDRKKKKVAETCATDKQLN